MDNPEKTLADLVKHLGRYPEEAFIFVREGLGEAADHVHGLESKAHQALQHYLTENDIDWDELVAQYHTGQLPGLVVQAIDAAGGCDQVNRHVSGRELCWALRDIALKRWGILARVVLESWDIKETGDFGRIVFGFIDLDMMRKQDQDSLEDFSNVYSFAEAFDEPFSAGLRNTNSDGANA